MSDVLHKATQKPGRYLLEQSSPCLPVSHVHFPVVLSQSPALLQSSGHFKPTVKKNSQGLQSQIYGYLYWNLLHQPSYQVFNGGIQT